MIPKLHYFGYYLEYISYINNQHHVNALDRAEAARAYYCLFFEKEPSPDLEGKELVLITVLDCLNSLLYH